jgi:hypothetical protein
MRIRCLMLLSALTAVAGLRSLPAEAGCGCAKPPPAMDVVRPSFASPGDNVTFFPPDNQPGEYEVQIGDKTIQKTAVLKRDLADGTDKWQVVVKAPQLPPGPTAIEVRGPGSAISVPATDFTMMQAPLVLQEGDGETIAKCYSAAVTADHIVLIPLDITAIDDHILFNGLGEGYPLLFRASDVMIYNTQGFLMQLLTTPNAQGIYEIEDYGQPDSLALTYDRHEFVTYRQQHAHVGGLGLDPLDHAWHTDGTYHVDHNRLVLAIKGVVEFEGAPPAGKTPNFDFSVITALADRTGAPLTRTITWSNACTAASTVPAPSPTATPAPVL